LPVSSKSNNTKGKTVTFIIPFALPGSGKSFCWDAISNHLSSLPNWSYQSVSSDEIRGELIKDTMKI